MTNGLLRACFRGVFHLPGHEDGTDMDTSLYVRTVEALDSLLQALVSSAGACGFLELQNILKLLLPFTQQQPEAVEERAMARIAGLAAFLNTCSLPQVSSCFAGATVLRHHHPEKHRFAFLGRLVGYLLLCCTCESEGKSHEAAKAVRHLCLFVAQQRSTRLCDQDAEQPQGWQSWRARLSLRLSEDSNSNRMFMIFMKYLQPSERLGVFLAAVQSMRAPSPHSTELAAHMVDVLAAETDFHSGQVLHIVWAIYRSLPSVRAALALQSLDRALLLLASKRPRETVASLLQCSLTCTSVAVTMWRAMVSEPPATERVLRELLRILMNQSGCKTSTSTKDHPRILALAAARPLHEILLLPTSRGEAKAIFPQLFLALLFQVSFTTELKLQEVQVFWEKHRQDLLTPVRSTVQALKALLRSVGLGSQVLAIEAQGGWAALLSAESHLWGVQVVAREMKELPRSLRATIIHQLVELLRTEASSWQTVAMVILSKLLECTELGDELDCVVSLFASYLRSPCLGMQSLVLRAILGLTERPATARQTLVLLPSITEQLQAADSDTRAVALPVLSTMLRLLEGRTLSLAALELAGKLPALFGDDSSMVRLLSIRLFLDTLGFVEGSQEKLQQVAHRSLLPLSLHLHDQDESVAEASREALLGVARFLRWRQLAHLAETLQSWKISECLVRTVLHPGPGPGPGPPCAEPAPFPLQLARRSSAAEEYLAQSLPYLQSLQEPLRREAVRFTGLVGRHLLDQHQSKSQDICQVLRGLANDPCESVSSLAIQTVQILQAPRPRSRFSFRQLCSRLQKAWRRRRSSPAGS
ncbi:maestro heat-like repeat family member 5 [Anas acuta]|uniref:maestro heat-like repeat family member 5 n=1 Tax=Anas acuta TaxID=28680 RepID=UPI0035C93F0E